MSNGNTTDPNDAALVQWATRQLGLDATASQNAVRAAVRARLAEDDFLPALRRQQAVQLLCRADRPKVLPPLALDDEEQRLREEIDEFVQRFFQLGSAERRRQWRALQRQCQLFPPLAARLGALEAGLDAPATDALPTEPAARELAEQLQSLFTARPAARPGLRRSLLKKLEPEMDRWMAAAWDFRAKYPPLVALDARFVEQLANWKQRKKQQARGRKKRIPVPVESSSTGGGSSGWGGGQYAWIVIVIVVGLLRLLASGSGSKPAATYKSYSPPTFHAHGLNLSEEERRRLAEIAVGGKRRFENPQLREWLKRKQWEREHPEWPAMRAASTIGLLGSSQGPLAGLVSLAVSREQPVTDLDPGLPRPDEKLPPNRINTQP